MNARVTWAAVLTVYITGAVVTFGAVWNRYDCRRPGNETSCAYERPAGALLGAMFWPLAVSAIAQGDDR